MELRQLRYFAAVARELNFSRAAESLRVAQPAVSRQIRQLEDEIGVKLIERTSARVQLTDAGRAFEVHVARLLTQIDIAVTAAQEAQRGNQGRLVISNDWRLFVGVIPGSVAAFRAAYPAVDLDVIELPLGEQIGALRDGRVQLGFLPGTLFSAHEEFDSLPVMVSEIIAILPPQHPFARRAQIRLVELKRETWLWVNASGPSHRQSLVQLCRLAGFAPKFGKSAPTLQGLLGLVASGYGIALLPRSVLPERHPHLRYVPTDSEPLEIFAIWRRDEHSVQLQRFLEILRRHLQ